MHDLTTKQSILTLYLLTHKIQLPCKRRILQIRKLLYVFSVCYSSFFLSSESASRRRIVFAFSHGATQHAVALCRFAVTQHFTTKKKLDNCIYVFDRKYDQDRSTALKSVLK